MLGPMNEWAGWKTRSLKFYLRMMVKECKGENTIRSAFKDPSRVPKSWRPWEKSDNKTVYMKENLVFKVC